MKNGFTPDTRILQIGMIVLTVLFYFVTARAQTPIPSPSPAPTPITKTGSILVANPSSVGRISKWVGSSNNGIGTIGDSGIIESSIGTIGIGTNPFADFRLGVDGGNTISGGVFGSSSVFNGTGLRGRALHPNSGTGVSGFGTTGLFGQTLGNNPNGNNIGVWGVSGNSSGIGVRGQNTSGGLAGKFDGDVAIIGNLSVTGTSNLTATNSLHANTADSATNANNANTVTNGVYTTGSYPNPSWITSLAASKITGVVANANQATIADSVNVPLNLTGTGNVITATSTSNSGTGVLGFNETHQGFGVRGIGGAFGLYGVSVGDNDGPEWSIGVFGNTAVFNGTGVSGRADHPNSGTGVSGFGTIGVYGETVGNSSNGNNVGLYGIAGSSGVAIRGTNTGGGLAGRFDGDVAVNGSLDATSINAINFSSAGTINFATNPIDWTRLKNVPNAIASGQFVNSVNGLDNAVTLAPGNNVTISPSGNTLTISASSAPSFNPLQLATLRWYNANNTGIEFPVGVQPHGLAFDGANIWVANWGANSVTKLRANDGVSLGTFSAGSSPQRVAFDGANVWVTNSTTDTVTKLRATDGTVLGTFTVGDYPQDVAFDGSNIWVSNYLDNTVTKLKANDGSLINTFSVGQGPNGVAFDGTNVWVGSQDNKVTKLRALDGISLGEFPTGDGPTGIAFDGSSIWISNSGNANVTKLRASDGSLLGTYPVGSYPTCIAFDGTNVWVASFQSNTVTKLRVSDGAVLGTFATGANSVGVAFDGINIWVSNFGSDSLSKR